MWNSYSLSSTHLRSESFPRDGRCHQLEILKLREQTRQKLGDKFDLRTFHDEVLGNGALPLDILDSEVNAWIDGQEK
jgi:hypothetical protein